MEKKLAEYRARKLKEALEQRTKTPRGKEEILVDQPVYQESQKPELERTVTVPSTPYDTSFRKLEFSISALKVVLWCLLMALFVVLEFGAVFFVLSIFYFMYSNFRTSPKKPGEVSAYSVFNPNCEAINGTLKAEQFEAELKYGATAVQ